MQNKEKETVETRPFAEIWSAMDEAMRSELRSEIVRRTHVTTQAVRNWANRVNTPAWSVRKDIAAAVTTVTGAKCYPNTLF